jgi:hypothetical protein
MNLISHNSKGQYTVIIFHRKQNWNCQKKWVSLNTDILIHLQLKVIQFAQRNSTTHLHTAISPTSSMEFFLHGITARNYPPRHCLSTTSSWQQCRMQCIQCTPLLGTIHNDPGPQFNCSRLTLLWTMLSRALCVCTTKINVNSCYKIVWMRSHHQQDTLYIV